MIKYCEIIERKEVIFILANLGTQPGVRLTSKPVITLSQPVQAEDLGRAVLETLDAFQSGIKHPSADELKLKDKELLSLTGFSSWRKLSKDARRLGIQAEGNFVIVTPTAAGPAGGYADIAELAIRSVAEPNLVGEAILEAVSRCTTRSKIP